MEKLKVKKNTTTTEENIRKKERKTMSENWVKDMNAFHEYYGIHDAVDKMDDEKLKQFLIFRLAFLKEELDETFDAFGKKDPEEIVDGLIDLCVIAIGTLDLFKVDAQKAWTEVLRANLSKEVGEKPERPNPLGLPDLIKPAGWKAPNHGGNSGILTKATSRK